MNILITNKNREYLTSYDYNAIKEIHGEYNSKDIVSMLSGIIYDKIILDVTAIKDYHDLANIRALATQVESSRIFLLLSNEIITTSTYYISNLIQLGIYNFTIIPGEILKLLQTPRNYEQAKLVDFSNINQSTVVNNNTINNNTINNNSNTNNKVVIIGFKNITEHAGSTTLIYMLKNSLEQIYKKSVVALELNKTDFNFFDYKSNGFSIQKEEISDYVTKYQSYDFILIDLNESNSDMMCDQVFYLIEPTTIKMKKLISKDRTIISKLNGKMVLLNKSLLDKREIQNFSYETKLQVWGSLPPLNEKINNGAIYSLADSLVKFADKRRK